MEKVLRSSPFVPFDPNIYTFVSSEGQPGTVTGTGGVQPFEYTGWWDEMLSYYDNCYIHAGLNPCAVYKITGPDSIKFFKRVFTNSFEKFKIGTGKHAIMCNEQGKLARDGVLLRMGEEEFLSFWIWPQLGYALEKSGLNVKGENLCGQRFLYQLAGPASLHILEEAAGESLTDIKFINFRDSMIAGKKVFILRIGMAGSLAYEVHGETKDALEVYNAILKAGEAFGIRRLGRHGYRNTHTEGGFPQNTIHFTSAPLDEGYAAFAEKQNLWGAAPYKLTGSMGSDMELRYRNPVELGWGGMVRLDHDFVGRAALEKELASPSRKPVTLVWNKEDVLDVWSSLFSFEEPYAMMDFCEDVNMTIGSSELRQDQVLLNGKLIGNSTGRMFSPKCREMISLGIVDSEHCELGKEVTVLWGDAGKKQKLMRCKIERWPYLSEGRNENLDVTKLVPKKE